MKKYNVRYENNSLAKKNLTLSFVNRIRKQLRVEPQGAHSLAE